MVDSRDGAEKKWKISLEHLTVPGSKEALKTKFRTSKDISANLKVFLKPRVEEV